MSSDEPVSGHATREAVVSLTPERWQQVKVLLSEALDAPVHSREAWLSDRTETDPELGREVLSLLAALQREPDRFESGPAGPVHLRALELLGTRAGPWLLVREIGGGGMGVVFEGQRADEHFHKRVAVKTISAGLGTEQVLRRFRLERQVLARLEHRNIAALFDGGVTQGGHPFFAMELVEGEPIVSWADAQALDVASRIRLFLQVCGAVQYAHRNLVVHRDLKPGNILVTQDGTVKLLDFGIAKVLGGDAEPDPVDLTRGEIPFTTAYASPEQVRGEPVSTATDVFSLGVVLYQLLAGRHPFNHDQPGADEVRRRIREVDPGPPSRSAGGALRRIPRAAQNELDAIVLMALRKEPERRYESVEEMARDLRRYLDGFPVTARPDRVGYRAGKFVRRNRAAVIGAAGMVVLLVAGLIGTASQARLAAVERDRARAAAVKAERVNEFLQATLGAADPSWYSESRRPGPQTTLGELLEDAGQRAEAHFAELPDALADVLRTVGRANQALRRLDLSLSQLERARALHVEAVGPASSAVAADEHELGMAHSAAGDLRLAEAWFRRSLATFRAAGDSVSDLYGRTLSDLGITLGTMGRPAEAEPFIRASAQHRRGLDSTSVANAIILGNLGLVLSQQGKLEEAEPVYRQALAAFDGHGREYFEKGYTLGNLAVDLILRGRPDEAIPLAREQVEVFSRGLGPNHVAVGYGWVNLARALHGRGEHGAALEAAGTAESIFRRSLPSDHPDLARTESIIGQVMASQGRLTEAERRLRRALAIRRAKLAAGSPHIADVELALGNLLARAGKRAEAESLLVAAGTTYGKVLAGSDPRRSAATRSLQALREQRAGGAR